MQLPIAVHGKRNALSSNDSNLHYLQLENLISKLSADLPHWGCQSDKLSDFRYPVVGPNLGEICKYLYLLGKIMKYGGGGGIRTHGRLSPTSVFKTGAFNHSATPPTRHGLFLFVDLIKGVGKKMLREI